MSEWQPAIIVDAHSDWGPAKEWWDKLVGKRVRLRPLPNAIFHVHDDDAKHYGLPASSTNHFVCCEHEILTD